MYSRKMLASDRGTGRVVGDTENDSPTAWPGVGYGSWPTISTRTAVEGLGERAQHVGARGQVAPARGDLGAQEVAHVRDPLLHRGERPRPPGLDDLRQRFACHQPSLLSSARNRLPRST